MKKIRIIIAMLMISLAFSACGEATAVELPLSAQYIYNSLNEKEKKEYSRFYDAVTNFKYSAKVKDMNEDEFEDFFLKFYCSRVDTFFLNNNVQYRVNMTGKVSECLFSYDKFSGSTENMKTQIDAVVDKVISEIPSGASDAEKLKYIHDYLVDNTTYNMEVTDSDNIYGALVKHKTHCQGYSKSIAYFCDRLGIESLIITGDAGGPHMWNMVKVDGKWYHLDATWDDPDLGKRSYNFFFLVSDSTISSTHTPDDYIKYPPAPSDYNMK